MIDEVPLLIDEKYLRPLSDSLHEAFLKEVENDTPKEIELLMAGDPRHVTRRKELEGLIKGLQEAIMRLRKFDNEFVLIQRTNEAADE
jgi:hypothetical protein